MVVLVVRASALAGHEGFMGSGSKGLSYFKIIKSPIFGEPGRPNDTV